MIGIAWQISHWRVFEVQLPGRTDRTRHFAGYSLALRIPKISAPIVELAPVTKRGTDDVGNVFALIGVSRVHDDVERAWDAWVARSQAHDVLLLSHAVTGTLVQFPDAQPLDWRRDETAAF